MSEFDGITDEADLMRLRANLDAVLSSRDLEFSRDLDEDYRDSLRASWRQLARARGGILSSADIHDTIGSYLRIGLVRRTSAAASTQPETLRRSLPKAAARLMAAGTPARPTDANHPYPTIARIAPGTGRGSRQHAVPSVAYGSFSKEFDTLLFESQDEEGLISVFPVAHVDQRFAKLIGMLAKRNIALVIYGERDGEDLGVWDLVAVDGLSEDESLNEMDPGLLEMMLGRLRVLPEPAEPSASGQGAASKSSGHAGRPERRRPHAAFASIDDMESYLACMEDTLPANIRTWAWQNLELAQNERASKEERRHATRALSLVLSVQWGRPPFHRVDPVHARQILDQQLYGLDSVKQRVIETIVQINRTHTLPLYGLLLAGPAGVGKSQIAYATARILNLPWASLDMSAIRDLAGLIGSDRVYSNAKPGRVMEALAHAGSANMVLVLNELDKAGEGGQGGSSADALLTLFDNLGFTDNYVECSVPTDGIYPIATANELDKISGPLLSRFEVIEIPDYSPEEKRVILKEFSLPKVLAHMGLRGEEFSLTDAALDWVIERYRDEPGCRGLEKAAEHLAAHALFLLESEPGRGSVTFDAADVRAVLEEG